MNEKRYYVNCALYLCDKDLDNTLSIFECADLLNRLTEENEQLRQSHNKSECFYCKHCFRDDNYGVCCENRNSEHFTPHWDLHWENISGCEYFERIGCDDV